MNKHYIFFTFLILGKIISGQEFSYEMYFEDAIGNKDTLIIGYDINATDSIDPIFGEVNIISIPLDSLFDVRITDEWNKRSSNPAPGQEVGTFHTKKQIVKGDCYNWPGLITIDIHCKNWPVTAFWDNSLFYDSCRNGSFITSCLPGGWWDVPGPSNLWRIIYKDTNSVEFTSNFDGTYIHHFNYININYDTIPYFWMAFADSTILIWGINENLIQNGFEIFPNPSNGYLTIDLKNEDLIIKNIELFDLNGKKHYFELNGSLLNIKHLTDGQYFILLTFQNDQQAIKKFIIK